ncbi:hypothetical protein BH10PSE2_BH10PSE2_11540 [soil metagenome]
MTRSSPASLSRAAALAALVTGALMLQGCLVGAVVGTGAAIVGTGAKVTGAVVGAGFDAVTTSDQETRQHREREQRDYDRQQRRCQQMASQGRRC